MKTMHRLALGIGAGALLIGGVAGASTLASAADPTPAPTASASAPATSEDRGRPGLRWLAGVAAAELAEKLGLDQARVAEAISAAKDTVEASGAEGEARRDAFVTALATELGVEETALREAIEEIRTERQAERRDDLEARLADAVADGTLTQAEADAVLKAADAGLVGYNRGGRR